MSVGPRLWVVRGRVTTSSGSHVEFEATVEGSDPKDAAAQWCSVANRGRTPP